MTKITRDGIQMTGVRASESVQRLQYIARMKTEKDGLSSRNAVAPRFMIGRTMTSGCTSRSTTPGFPRGVYGPVPGGNTKAPPAAEQLFASESIAGLRQVAEVDPTLWERIERREPNAYLTLLYWDSEMFHRSTRKRRQMEGEVQKDNKAILTEMLLKHPEKYFTNEKTYHVAMQYRRFFIKSANMMTPQIHAHHARRVGGGRPQAAQPESAVYRRLYRLRQLQQG